MKKVTAIPSHTIQSFQPKHKNWIKVTIIILVIAILSFSLIFSKDVFMPLIGEFLITDESLLQTEIVVVLAGDSPLRSLEAADLFKEGWVKNVLLTKGPRPNCFDDLKRLNIYVPEDYEISKTVLLASGVPEDRIHILKKRINSTYSEAKEVLKFLNENGYHKAIIVTSKIHTRRAKMTYKRLIKRNNTITIRMKPSRHDLFSTSCWWYDRQDLRDVLLEYEKLVYYKFRYIFS